MASLLPGSEKARVAPSEGKVEAAAFGIGGLGGVGAGEIGGAGATYEAGCGGANGSLRGSGNTGAGSADRGRPDGGAVVLGVTLGNEFGMVPGNTLGMLLGGWFGIVPNGVPEVREGMSELNQPVNPVPAGSFPTIPFPAIPDVGGGSSGCGFTAPNMAVKSPTVFRGGSGGGEMLGVSEGRSPRNGP